MSRRSLRSSPISRGPHAIPIAWGGLHHVAATAGAADVVGLDHPLDARQLLGQGARGAGCARLLGPAHRSLGLGRAPARTGLGLGDGGLEILERQRQLVGVQLLRARPEAGAAILAHQMLEPLDVALGVGELGLDVAARRRFRLSVGLGCGRALFGLRAGHRLGLDMGPQLGRQRARIGTGGLLGHARTVAGEVVRANAEDEGESIRRSRRSYPSWRHPPPIEPVEQRLELRPREPHHAVLHRRPSIVSRRSIRFVCRACSTAWR
jgi:hypothetical protein